MAGLGINLPSLIAQIINFVILFGLLYLVAYKPMMATLDARSARIKESMDKTEQIKEQAERAEEDFKKRLAEASARSQTVIEQAMRTGEEVRSQAALAAKTEAEALLERARAEIRHERDETIDQLRRHFAELTVLAAGKVIDKSLEAKEHQALIDKVLSESTVLGKG